jgi:hypothetical protein
MQVVTPFLGDPIYLSLFVVVQLNGRKGHEQSLLPNVKGEPLQDSNIQLRI